MPNVIMINIVHECAIVETPLFGTLTKDFIIMIITARKTNIGLVTFLKFAKT